MVYKIKESIENDSTWTPTIYIPTTKWSKEDAKSNTFLHVHEYIVYLDIVQLLTPSSNLMQKIKERNKKLTDRKMLFSNLKIFIHIKIEMNLLNISTQMH
jgi:hypothetical protein